MSTLIAMAVFDTEENKRSQYTAETLDKLEEIFYSHSNHRIIVVDNASCYETKAILNQFKRSMNGNFQVITNYENKGTAKAINQALVYRKPNEFFIKMDNDVVIRKRGWIEEMEEVITRMPSIGILGLKRNDICESVYSINTDQRSRLIEVQHEVGQRWYVVEECKHVMGTCTMLNPALLDKVGYFYQMDGLYGFDDSIMCVRSTIAGFLNCFLHGIAITHLDPGGDEYTKWKDEYAGRMLSAYAHAEKEYKMGIKDIYYDGK